jgi:nucleoid-associated protein YgaU
MERKPARYSISGLERDGIGGFLEFRARDLSHGGTLSDKDGRKRSWKIFDVCNEMNDPAIKIALAMSILLGGFLTAIAFRPAPTGERQPTHSWAEIMALRNRRPSERTPAAPSRQPIAPPPQAKLETPPSRNPTVLAPLDNPPPLPAMPAKYPGDGAPNSTGWGIPIASTTADNRSAETGPRTHVIVDGDTLASLSKRYFGTPERAMEIFEANKNFLNDPHLLPIGVEVKIP